MYSIVKSGAIHGIDGMMIDVEADVSDGLPLFMLVGLLSSEVREAAERVKNAIRNSGFRLNAKHVTINLSPADVKKSGTAFDLAIAMAVMCGYGYVLPEQLEGVLFLGELGLDGDVKPVKGVLPIVDEAKKNGIRLVIVPLENLSEAKLVEGIECLGVKSYKELMEHFLNDGGLYTEYENENMISFTKEHDLKDIKGQKTLRRALEIAVAGMHNILIGGPPGAGKSLIAKCIPGIMPELTYAESMELTKIYSTVGMSENGSLIRRRPFRSPHSTISAQALVGGGRIPKPGEVTLAHRGVLFLDEFPEFTKHVIEMLRQPMEDRKTTVSRVDQTLTFPSDFMLVAAMNLCPCGYFPDRNRCRCTERDRLRYIGKISQPIMDRIDIQVMVEPVGFDDICSNEEGEGSEVVRERIKKALDHQSERYMNEGLMFNSRLEGKRLFEVCKLDDEGNALLRSAGERLGLSARGAYRVLRVARTIADLAESEDIRVSHLTEAIGYRDVISGIVYEGGEL
ncbi:MAG: YifB family Mg chelatase-like AAA ATPase [Lachnospiraceae bacterium]|nr:YifB family Mg chelatase-like AAA ATPase [Lachnospiraceae bacterium]